MKVVFIAPLPPPFNGNTLAAKIVYEELGKKHEVELINLNKKSLKSGKFSISRIIQMFEILPKVWKAQKKADVIYFSITESTAGNVKDILIYILCFGKLSKTFIHMLGGAGMKSILDKKGIQYWINKFFISRLAGVVVEGWPQADTFSQVIDRDRIHIVPNFAEDFLFVDENSVQKKYENTDSLKIVFLSNLLYGKGYNELVEGYLSLDNDLKNKVKITFIGGFGSDQDKEDFLEKIKHHDGLVYQGFVSGEEKKAFYLDSHIFCLPTYYPYEGQPISIIEAYATGCVVVVTEHSGIPQIFKDKINGFAVEKKSVQSIKNIIEYMYMHQEVLLPIGLYNRNTAADNYTTAIYKTKFLKIIESVEAKC